MSRWDDERAQTMLSTPEAPSAGGAWAAVSENPDSNDPTLTRDMTRSGLGAKAVLAPGACPDENLLVELAEGKLAGSARTAIDRHLDSCPECSRLVIELAKLATPARAAPKRYNILRQLGAGAMGVVWEAEDTHLHRKVALKFVKPEGVDDKALRKRLLREARALAQVRHPNVMAVYDAGEADDEVCLVLELVNGSTARGWRAAAPRTVEDIVGVWRQAAAGLSAVHKAGIVHRDIKPDNVFVSDDGRVLIGDFGLARGGDLAHTTTTLTVSGAVIGTPLYMSPEQLHGATASKKSDQFALCASIWEGILDERPFRGTTIAAIVLAMQKVPEIPKTATAEQRRVLQILQKGLDPDPAKRFDDIDGLIAALAHPPRHTSRTALWIGLGAVVLAVAGTVAVLAATRSPVTNGSSRSGSGSGSGSGSNLGSTVGSNASSHAGSSGTSNAGSNAGSSTGSNATTAGAPGSNAAGSNGPGAPAGGPPKQGETLTVKDDKGQLRRFDKPTPPKPDTPKTVPSVASGSGAAVAEADVSYTHLMMRAADRLNFGDGAGCLKLLANLPELPDDEMRRVELVKANCRMATGDCVGAATALEAAGKKLGWDVNQIRTTTESSDKAYCPIDAPPQARWPERAQYRLQVAAGLGRSCKAILDIIAKHKIALPDARGLQYLEVQCAVNVGDCADAKQKYTAWMVSNGAQNGPTLEADFHRSFKKCPAPP